eukprot:SAG22_NODE_658_length_8076_cov_4.575279_3_plen_989_part_00
MGFKSLLATSALLVGAQAQDSLSSSVCSSVDTNADGGVDIRDLLAVLSFFNVDCGVDGASPNTPWRAALNPDTCPEACIRKGMDYGGNPGNGCGFAPILKIVIDHQTWATEHTPGWFSGPVEVSDQMVSPQACQAACQDTEGCAGFAFEYEETDGAYYHECYVKTAYADPFCMIDPFVVWEDQAWASGRGDPDWHAASGLATCGRTDYEIDYSFFDISTTGVVIADAEWTNPANDNGWPDDDGYFDVQLPFSFMWFGIPEDMISIGTNGLITFGGAHLRNGASEPIPCINFCERGQNYGSHASHHAFGVDGVIAPMWSDLNPCAGTGGDANICGGNGGGGMVMYQTYADSVVVQWEQVRNYVSPGFAMEPGGVALGLDQVFPGCADSDNYWTPACPASQDPTSSTFQAVMFSDGGVTFSYKDIPAVDLDHGQNQDQHRGTGLSWSKVSIGYEDKSGALGAQISYGVQMTSGTTYYVPPTCSAQAEPKYPIIDVAQCPEPCVKPGMDYGGGVEPFSVCGYAPTVEIVTDVEDFAAPGWFSGPNTYDATLTNAYACQVACQNNDDCDFFSYEYQARNWTQPYVHRCYLKASFEGYTHSTTNITSASICEPAYVTWRPHNLPTGRPDPSWHGSAGPKVCPTEGGFNGPYNFFDIADSGTTIGDLEWTNPLNTWSDDDGWFDISLSKPFIFYGERQMSVSVGTNGLITFGSMHLRNGASEPMPCDDFCGRNTGTYGDTGYGSHADYADWGVNGVIAPMWSDINPCAGTDGPANVCGGNGGGGMVMYQEFAASLVVQWEAVRNYVDPDPSSTAFPGCADSGNFWTPACPASQDPTSMTFNAVLYMDGTFSFNYKEMVPVDLEHPNTHGRGTGLSWSPASIGFEDKTGYMGTQISYGEAPVMLLKAVITAFSLNFSAFPCGSTALTADRCNQTPSRRRRARTWSRPSATPTPSTRRPRWPRRSAPPSRRPPARRVASRWTWTSVAASPSGSRPL